MDYQNYKGAPIKEYMTLNPRHHLMMDGGTIYLAESDGKFLVITDESIWYEFGDEEIRSMADELKMCYTFSSDAERLGYLKHRDWERANCTPEGEFLG
jgi:hypothetical protein